MEGSFEELVLQLNKYEPSEEFARKYLKDTEEFLRRVEVYRSKELQVA